MKFFSIFNSKVCSYNPPFMCEDSKEAITLLQKIIMQGTDFSLLALRDDLVLVEVGNFSSSTGLMTGTVDYDEVACDVVLRPLTVCTMNDIIETIPPHLVKSIPSFDVIDTLKKEIQKLEASIKSIDEKYASHIHHRKEILK